MTKTRRRTRARPSGAELSDSGSDAEAQNAVFECEPSGSGNASGSGEAEKCPACTEENANAEKESWIRCDTCKTWFHWDCVSHSVTPDPAIETGINLLDTIDKWHCTACLEANAGKKQITFKKVQPTRKSTRKKTQQVVDNEGSVSGTEATAESSKGPGTNKWVKILATKNILPDPFRRMQGSDVNRSWVEDDPTAFTEPVVIPADKMHGLGITMPEYTDTSYPPSESTFTVSDVSRIMGPDTPVQVIDVVSQSSSPGWTLGRWANYFHTPPEKRKRVLNVISLEVSDCKEMANLVVPPRVVRECDWVERFWPRVPSAGAGKKTAKSKAKGSSGPEPGDKEPGFPKVQLYCLMGIERAWTDWHVDFAGSSVYYHIYRGRKTFYFIRPTPHNLAAYTRWSSTSIQSTTWLGDLCAQSPKGAAGTGAPENDANVYRVELKAGDTMIIPSGWIHAVFTPEDTLVFGGNFLQGLGGATQLKIRQIEIVTKVPRIFRFPNFNKLCWHVGSAYLARLRSEQSQAHFLSGANGSSTTSAAVEPPPYPRPADDKLTHRLLEALLAVADFLMDEARLIEHAARIAQAASVSRANGASNGEVSSTKTNGTSTPPEKETGPMKEAKESIPIDYVDDPSAMARELRWRVRRAISTLPPDSHIPSSAHKDAWASDDDDEGFRSSVPPATGSKRKGAISSLGSGKIQPQKRQKSQSVDPREVNDLDSGAGENEVSGPFRNFRPKPWDYIHEAGSPSASGSQQTATEAQSLTKLIPSNLQLPSSTNPVIKEEGSSTPTPDHPHAGGESWQKWDAFLTAAASSSSDTSSQHMDVDAVATSTPEAASSSSGEVRLLHTHTHVLTKIRRTERGLERQRIQRVVEEWELFHANEPQQESSSSGHPGHPNQDVSMEPPPGQTTNGVAEANAEAGTISPAIEQGGG